MRIFELTSASIGAVASLCYALVLTGWAAEFSPVPGILFLQEDVRPAVAISGLLLSCALAVLGLHCRLRWVAKALAVAALLVVAATVYSDLAGKGNAWPGIFGSVALPTLIGSTLLSLGFVLFDPDRLMRLALPALAGMVSLATTIYALGLAELNAGIHGEPNLLMRVEPLPTVLIGFVSVGLLLLLFSIYLEMDRHQRSHGIVTALVVVGVASLVTWVQLGWKDFETVRNDSIQKVENAARVLEKHLYGTLDPVDIIFTHISYKVSDQGLESWSSSEENWSEIQRVVETLDQVKDLIVVDVSGDLQLVAREFPPPEVNYSSREYFQAYKAGAERHLGQIVQGVMARDLIFTYGRRLTDNTGEFVGLVQVSLKLDYFRDFYRTIDLGQGSALGLYRLDGKPLVRQPMRPEVTQNDLSGHIIYTDLVKASPTGTFVGRSPFDNEPKLAHFLASDRLPFVVNAVIGANGVVLPVERRLFLSSLFLVCLMGLICSIALIQRRAMARVGEALDKAEYSSRYARSVLDSMSASVVVLDSEGKIVDANESWREYARVNGAVDTNGFLGVNYLLVTERATGDYQPYAEAALQAIASVRKGRQKSSSHIYPCQTPIDKRWFKMRVDALEQTDGLVVSHQDVTDLKNAELAHLAAMRTDPLTKINNRIQFINEMEEQLVTARRLNTDLSLMLISVVELRKINEAYGLAAGDRILQTLVESLQSSGHGKHLIGRTDGNTFGILLSEVSAEGVGNLGNALQKSIAVTPVECGSDLVFCSVQFGVAVFHSRVVDAEELMTLAECALLKAKKR